MLVLKWVQFQRTSHQAVAPADWPPGQCCKTGCRMWCSWDEGESLGGRDGGRKVGEKEGA